MNARTPLSSQEPVLCCSLTPSGHIRLLEGATETRRPLSAAARECITAAFSKGRGHGVLHLGAAELATELDPTLGFWRDLGQQFVSAVCAALDPTDPDSFIVPEPDPSALSALAAAVPPMRGAELMSGALLGGVWADMGEALAAEAHERKSGVQGYLEAHDSIWNVVGRVCFHLAENKRDAAHPFAFIATYVPQLSKQGRVPRRAERATA